MKRCWICIWMFEAMEQIRKSNVNLKINKFNFKPSSKVIYQKNWMQISFLPRDAFTKTFEDLGR